MESGYDLIAAISNSLSQEIQEAKERKSLADKKRRRLTRKPTVWKKKLKTRGFGMYDKYYFNTEKELEAFVGEYDQTYRVNENHLSVVFDTDCIHDDPGFLQDLVLYYPQRLKDYRRITNEVVRELRREVQETIEILKFIRATERYESSIRNTILHRIQSGKNSLSTEDILLPWNCPYFNQPLCYQQMKDTKHPFAPKAVKIYEDQPWTEDNILIMSRLAAEVTAAVDETALLYFADKIKELCQP